MQNTALQFSEVINQCRDLFSKKLQDYGAAWRVLRPSSITDQIYIKVNRIRTLQMTDVKMVDEHEEDEFIAIVNYSIIGLIQLEKGFSENLDENGAFLSPETLKEKYHNLLSDASTPLSMTKKLIIHCGSGVTACHTILALDYAGFVTLSGAEVPNLYVGSWSEWSRREGKEIAKGV